MSECVLRITNYLISGGLFNPELMEHEKVSQLLQDCSDHISSLEKRIIDSNQSRIELQGKLSEVMDKFQAERNDVLFMDKKFKITEAALIKIRDDRSPPWDNMDFKQVARDALDKASAQ